MGPTITWEQSAASWRKLGFQVSCFVGVAASIFGGNATLTLAACLLVVAAAC